jgi:hypothetical protein
MQQQGKITNVPRRQFVLDFITQFEKIVNNETNYLLLMINANEDMNSKEKGEI